MKPLNPNTPKQIDSVVGVDRMDELDRQKLDPMIKLQLLCAEAKAEYGRDPRSGGFSIVARPRMILQLIIDLGIASALTTKIKCERAMVVGSQDGDRIGWWSDIPIIMRSSVMSDMIYCMPDNRIPESKMEDRKQAGRLRMAIHSGNIGILRDN